MTPETEVVVVGAGVMGLATARVLAVAGRRVTVLEQFRVGHDRGSSHGSSRIVRLSYPEARWVRLAQEAYPLWRQLEAESGRTLLEQRGAIDLGDWQPNRDALAACGVPFEVLDPSELARRFGIADDGPALFQPDGGIARADLVLEALLAAAVAAGAELHEGVRVAAIDHHGDSVTAGGVHARAAVVTVGAWAPGLVSVDATPTSETSSYFALEEPLPSVIDTRGGAGHGYALPAPGVGLKAGLHQSGLPVDPDLPLPPDAAILERTAEWVRRRFPGAGELVRSETCLYTTRAEDEFLLERRGRIVVGSACSGHGFKFAPAIGARLAALAAAVLDDR